MVDQNNEETQYHYVSYETYLEFIKETVSYINYLRNRGASVSLVGIYRGSLGMTAHLSNLTDAPMSIFKFQKYDGKDKEVSVLLDCIEENDVVIILDDIFDTGETLIKCKEFIETNHPKAKVLSTTLIGKPSNFDWHTSFIFHDNKSWYKFPWEV